MSVVWTVSIIFGLCRLPCKVLIVEPCYLQDFLDCDTSQKEVFCVGLRSLTRVENR
ncbi:hypothetical protein C8Q77DRAFT_1143484 [Trametes polyzona]|nr:hypothetical protein C8Q77DRAFT_1143484 [Trametes polyzona]